MAFQIPRPLHVEHEELHAELVKATQVEGEIGEAAHGRGASPSAFCARGSVCPATAECVIPFSRGEGHTGDAGCPPNDRQIADRAAADAC